jgi:hypothetical protein
MRISKVCVVTLKLLGLIIWVEKNCQAWECSKCLQKFFPKILKGDRYLGYVGLDITMLLRYIFSGIVVWTDFLWLNTESC